MKEELFDVLFSPKLEGIERKNKFESIFGTTSDPRYRLVTIDSSSIEFFEQYLQKILDEFPFIDNLKWRKYDDVYVAGDPPDLRFEIIINDIDFNIFVYNFHREVRKGYNDYLHPREYDPKFISSKLLKVNSSEHENNLNEWLRFIDGFILFNDLCFRFLKENETEPNLSLFQFEDEECWILEIEPIGCGTHVDFELKRKGQRFFCISKDFIPEEPLPPK